MGRARGRGAAWVGLGLLGLAVVATGALAGGRASAKGRGGDAKRGAYLVRIGGCNDCHTPYKMGEKGPEPDMTRMLSGHPEGMALPPAPKAEGPWIVAGSATLTAWAGPWGVSFAANLTSDKETGMGGWTEDEFLQAARTGKHRGRGRPILPPMPMPSLAAMTTDDLRSMFAYLRQVPAIQNKVPEPSPPAPAP